MNNNNQEHKLSLKIRFFRYLLPLLFIGLAAVILLLKMSKLENVINVFQSMPSWLVCIAVIAQVCSYLGSGYLLKVIMSLGKSQLLICRGAIITMASASVGLAGGWVSSAATTYYWVSKNEDVSVAAVLSGVLPALYNSAVLVVVTIIGMIYLFTNHELSSSQIVVYGIVLGSIVAGIFIFFYGIGHWDKVERLILGIVKKLNCFSKCNYDLTAVQNKIDHFYRGIKLLGKRSLIKPVIGSLLNIAFDMLTLYLLFVAAGYFIKPSVLVAGYSLAFLLGRSTFFVPGGAGVIEAGMVAIYTNLGIPNHVNVAAVLSYRLISFWFPSMLGFAAMLYLQRTSGHDK